MLSYRQILLRLSVDLEILFATTRNTLSSLYHLIIHIYSSLPTLKYSDRMQGVINWGRESAGGEAAATCLDLPVNTDVGGGQRASGHITRNREEGNLKPDSRGRNLREGRTSSRGGGWKGFYKRNY